MAILCAFQSASVEVIGLTTIFGNVPTPLATANALRLVEMAGVGHKVRDQDRAGHQRKGQHNHLIKLNV